MATTTFTNAAGVVTCDQCGASAGPDRAIARAFVGAHQCGDTYADLDADDGRIRGVGVLATKRRFRHNVVSRDSDSDRRTQVVSW